MRASREPRVPIRRGFCTVTDSRYSLREPETSRCFRLRTFTVLGLETSCDETAAAVVRGCVPGPGAILSNVVLSQLEEHGPFGGVVPEIAARAHVEALDGIVETALA